jgi:type I restriction enzyme S subunit
MEFLSGKCQLPGFEQAWETCQLSKILIEHKLTSSGNEEVFSVSVHKGLVNQIEHLGRSYAANETKHYNRVRPGDIVYTKSPTGEFPLGIIKRSAINKEVIVSPLYGVFTPVAPSIGEMLDALFESPISTRNFLTPLVQKGAKNTIAVTNARFLQGKVRIPVDIVEQERLAEIVRAAKAELLCLEKQAERISDQRQWLVNNLLTGQARIPADSGILPAHHTHIAREAAQ